MRQYLLPEKGSFYKANLHCHSTLSDGRLTPRQLADAYKAHGYSVLAITDHEFTADHSDLNSEGFLMLQGYETYVKERPDDSRRMKTCHMNFIAKDPAQLKLIMVDPEYCTRYAAKNGVAVEDLPRVGDICRRRYEPRCINEMIRAARENGYLVAYNHPGWSLESIEELSRIHGFYAMEIYNHDCSHYSGFPGDDSRVYDQLLRLGYECFCLATDDNHNKEPFDHPACDSFGGFTMIKAEELTYGAIIAALEKGHIYASQGPQFQALYVEDGQLHVECSDVRAIHLITCCRTSAHGLYRQVYAPKGETINAATIPLLKDDEYFRVEICDREGYKAWSHAYQLRDLDISEFGE